jgi:hypothetical protein
LARGPARGALLALLGGHRSHGEPAFGNGTIQLLLSDDLSGGSQFPLCRPLVGHRLFPFLGLGPLGSDRVGDEPARRTVDDRSDQPSGVGAEPKPGL